MNEHDNLQEVINSYKLQASHVVSVSRRKLQALALYSKVSDLSADFCQTLAKSMRNETWRIRIVLDTKLGSYLIWKCRELAR